MASPAAIRHRLGKLLPGLDAYLDEAEVAADDSATLCSIFAETSSFVRGHYEQLTTTQRNALGQFISECFSQPDNDLSTAVATCFLENLTFEHFSEDFAGYLNNDALQFYRDWQTSYHPQRLSRPRILSMKLNYQPDTDSLYIALSSNLSTDSNEVAEGVVLDFDAAGRLVGIDIDNANHKLDLHELTTEQIPVRVSAV